MNTEIGVWLAIAAMALVGANIGLRRARRSLSQSRQDSLLREITSAHDAVLVPAALPETARPASSS